ncbi:unnamed protein product [Rotaria sp. Silwood1]|nr:unnamed protein product [Rotaria sp. Silwood1]
MQFYDINLDEIIDGRELTIKESSSKINKRSLILLLADFTINILAQNTNLIDEYSQRI